MCSITHDLHWIILSSIIFLLNDEDIESMEYSLEVIEDISYWKVHFYENKFNERQDSSHLVGIVIILVEMLLILLDESVLFHAICI